MTMATLPIAITQGDPAGIGPEIIATAFRDAPDVTRGCFVAGDVATLRRAAKFITGPGLVGLPVAEIRTAREALEVPPRCIPVLPVLQAPELVQVGVISASAGRMAADCVTWAARAAVRPASASRASSMSRAKYPAGSPSATSSSLDLPTVSYTQLTLPTIHPE